VSARPGFGWGATTPRPKCASEAEREPGAPCGVLLVRAAQERDHRLQAAVQRVGVAVCRHLVGERACLAARVRAGAGEPHTRSAPQHSGTRRSICTPARWGTRQSLRAATRWRPCRWRTPQPLRRTPRSALSSARAPAAPPTAAAPRRARPRHRPPCLRREARRRERAECGLHA
jgi:hypothetical protein